MSLQKRIQSVIEKTGMHHKELAGKLGVSPHSFYKWAKGTEPRGKDYDKVMKALDNILEDTPSDTLVGEPKPKYTIRGTDAQPSQKSQLISIFLTHDEEPGLYIEGKVIAGNITKVNGAPALIAYRNDSSVIGDVDGLIYVQEESMEPEFKRGSLIAIRRLKYPEAFNAGYYYYVIDKNEHGMLRRLYPAANSSFTLQAENEKYPAIVKSMNDVLAIFKVEEVLTKR